MGPFNWTLGPLLSCGGPGSALDLLPTSLSTLQICITTYSTCIHGTHTRHPDTGDETEPSDCSGGLVMKGTNTFKETYEWDFPGIHIFTLYRTISLWFEFEIFPFCVFIIFSLHVEN